MIPEQTLSLHFVNDDITLLSNISQALLVSTTTPNSHHFLITYLIKRGKLIFNSQTTLFYAYYPYLLELLTKQNKDEYICFVYKLQSAIAFSFSLIQR